MRWRVEDEALLTGRGRFSGDVMVPGLLHVAYVRSSHAHARILRVDTAPAVATPGVAAVYTARDLRVGPVFVAATTGFIPAEFRPPAIACDVVRYVGEILAVVVAESAPIAADAVEAIEVDYDPLPVAVTVADATADGAPIVFPDFGSNVAVDLPFVAGERGDSDTVAVTIVNANNRMACAPIEPNAITVVPDGDPGQFTAWAATQMPHNLRDNIVAAVGMERDDLRLVAPEVGGSFGGKVPAEKEYALAVAVARELGRPVRFVQDRSENLVTMNGRGTTSTTTLEATLDGRLAAMTVDLVVDGGAYPGVGIGLAMTTRGLAPSVYRLPYLDFRIRGVVTNTAPVGSFRGAGRPEACALVERAMDVLAAELDLDPVELRRRNLLPRDAFPYASMTGYTYDSGDYEAALDAAVALAGYGELRKEQARRRAVGDPVALGIGVSMYVEVSAGIPLFHDASGSVCVGTDGRVTVVATTSAHGQGHVSTYTGLVAGTLGISPDRIDVLQGDTDLGPTGMGTGGSASAQMGGSAVKLAADEVLAKARRVAAHLLEASAEDVVVDPDGAGLHVRGVPTSIVSWPALAAAAADPARLPEGMTPGLSAAPGFHQEGGTFPFGCHIAVVEVDTETGFVRVRAVYAVDDCGTVLNQTIVEGQVHGGLAAGIGQALFEEVLHDEHGNPLASTFATYAMPSAAEFPSFVTAHTVTPSPKNPLGAKGVGEAGTTGSTAAVHNAVVDALAHLGVRQIPLPLSPERVWRAIQDARLRGAGVA
jgi:carbon-monoxide dehydrogenase large subunit